MTKEMISEMIEQFYENHPVWFWLLVRLAACVTIMSAVIFGLLAVACCIFAIAALVSGNFGILVIFLIFIPVLSVCTWAAVYAFGVVYEIIDA